MTHTDIEWITKPLHQLCEQVDYGHTESASLQPVGPKFLRITDIQNGSVNWDTVPYCRATSTELDRYRLRKGDILFARTGGTTGKSFLIEDCPLDAVFASYLIRVRPSLAIEPRFLARYFDTPSYWNQIKRESRGAGQPGVNASRLKSLIIPLPPLPEQKRIADILDKADAIRRKWRVVACDTDRLYQSTFYNLFGDPLRNPKGWPVEKLGAVADLDRGRSRHRPRDAAFLYGGPYPFIQTGDITNSNGFVRQYSQTYSEGGLAQSKLWPAGTLCITIAANIAKTAILTFDACFPDSVVGLIPSEHLTTEYVRYWFVAMEKAIDAAATQVAQKNINLQILRGLDIQVPPIKLQNQFTATISRLRTYRDRLVTATDYSNDLFDSLVQRAFRGEL